MSYSFTVKASTKAEAIEKLTAEFDKVVAAQAVHQTDRDQAFAAAKAFTELLRDDETQDVIVYVCGSVWNTEAGLNNANVSVNAALEKRAS